MDIHRLRIVRFSNSNNTERTIKASNEKQQSSQIITRAIGDGAEQKVPQPSAFGPNKSGMAIYKAENSARLGRKSKSDTIVQPQATNVFQLGNILTNLGYRKSMSIGEIKKKLTQKKEQYSYFIGQTLQSLSKKKESTMSIGKKGKQSFQKTVEIHPVYSTKKQECSNGSITLRCESSLDTLGNTIRPNNQRITNDVKSNCQNLVSEEIICPEKISSHRCCESSVVPIKMANSKTNCRKPLTRCKVLSHLKVVNFSCGKVHEKKVDSTRFYQVNFENLDLDNDDQNNMQDDLDTDSITSCHCDMENKKMKKDTQKKDKAKELQAKKQLKSSKRKKRNPTILMCFCSKILQKLQNISSICSNDDILGRKILKYVLFSAIVVTWCPCIAALGVGWYLSNQCGKITKKTCSSKTEKKIKEKKDKKHVNKCRCPDPCSYGKKGNKKFKKSPCTPDKRRRETKYHVSKDAHKFEPYCYGQPYDNMFVHCKTNPNVQKHADDRASNHLAKNFNSSIENQCTNSIQHDNSAVPYFKRRYQKNVDEHKLLRTFSRPEISFEHQSVAMRGRPLTRDVKLVKKRSRSAVEVPDLNYKDIQQPPVRSSSEPKQHCHKIINSYFQTERKQKINIQNNRSCKNRNTISADDFYQTQSNNCRADSNSRFEDYPKIINHSYVTSRNETIPIGGYYFSDQIQQCCFEPLNKNTGFARPKDLKKLPNCKCAGNQTLCCGDCDNPKYARQKPKQEKNERSYEKAPKRCCAGPGTQTKKNAKPPKAVCQPDPCKDIGRENARRPPKAVCQPDPCKDFSKENARRPPKAVCQPDPCKDVSRENARRPRNVVCEPDPCKDIRKENSRFRSTMMKCKCKCHQTRLFMEPEEENICTDRKNAYVRMKSRMCKCCAPSSRICYKGAGDGLSYKRDKGVRLTSTPQTKKQKEKGRASQSVRKLKKEAKKSEKSKKKKKKSKKKTEKQSFDKENVGEWIRTSTANGIRWIRDSIKKYIQDCIDGKNNDDKICRDLFYEKDSCWKICRYCPSCYGCWVMFRRTMRPCCDCIVMCIASCCWCPFVCCYFLCCCLMRLC